tara:strand:- start:534 stop:1616 length:1083 start_codon:yes stop_codon:yes gene_type:complete
MKVLIPILIGLSVVGCVTVEKVEVKVDEKKLVEELIKPENIGKVLGTIFSSEEDEAASEEETRQFNQTKSKAQQGDADAQFTLGENYANGHGTKKDSKESMKWYRKAADQGHNKAVDIIITAEKEIAELRAKAKAGDADAQFTLGERGLFSDGGDIMEPIKWFRKAAEQGHPIAMVELSFLYLSLSPENAPINYWEQAVLWGNQAMIQLSAVNNLNAFKYEEALRNWFKRSALELSESEEHKFTVEGIQFIQLAMARIFYSYCTEWHTGKLPKGNQRDELFLKHLVVPYAWTIVMAENGIIGPKGKSLGDGIITMPINLADEKKQFRLDMFEKYFAKANALAKELLKKIEANKKAKSKNK